MEARKSHRRPSGNRPALADNGKGQQMENVGQGFAPMPISWPRKAGVLAFLLAVGLLNFWWFAGAAPVSSESPLRMVMGAVFLFVVPGLIWGEICGFRARHPW